MGEQHVNHSQTHPSSTSSLCLDGTFLLPPLPQQQYWFNTCHIAVVFCGISSTFSPRSFVQTLETKPSPLQVNGLQVWNQLYLCVFIASNFVLFSMSIVHLCMEGCALPPVHECVCWKEPSVAWPRLLWLIAPCLVTCQLISLWIRERPGRAIYSSSRSSPSLSL